MICSDPRQIHLRHAEAHWKTRLEKRRPSGQSLNVCPYVPRQTRCHLRRDKAHGKRRVLSPLQSSSSRWHLCTKPAAFPGHVPRALQQALKVIQLGTCCLISRREERVYRKGPLAVRQGWRQPGPGDAGLETGRRGPRPNVRRRLGTASAPPGRTRRRPAAAPGRKALGAWSVWLREFSTRGRARRRGGQGIAEHFPRPLVWGRRPEPAGGPAQQARLPGPSSFSP